MRHAVLSQHRNELLGPADVTISCSMSAHYRELGEEEMVVVVVVVVVVVDYGQSQAIGAAAGMRRSSPASFDRSGGRGRAVDAR